jgi:hypothetical protein
MYLPNIYMVLHSHGPGHYITFKPIYFLLTDSQSYMISSGLYTIIHLHIWGYTITQMWLRFHTLIILWSVSLLLYYTWASPVVLSMWSCTIKFHEEKSKYGGLGHKNGIGSAELHSLRRLVKGPAMLCTSRKEYTKYDLTAGWCFWLAHHNFWSRWFAISSSPPMCCPSFLFMGEVGFGYSYIRFFNLFKST